MARPLRIQFAGAIYHVMSRGNAKQLIFLHDNDRRLFLEELWRTCALRNWIVWAYCLMSNHYHLLIETLDPTLSAGMRDLNGRYTLVFNRRYGRVGHLFQSRFQAFLVQRERHLLEVARYIVLNPVRAECCATPEGYRWSSYRDVIGLRTGHSARLGVADTLRLFATDPAIARREYMRFVHAGVGLPAPEPHRDNPQIIGDDDFVHRLTAGLGNVSLEVPREQRRVYSLTEIVAEAGDRTEAIVRAYATGAYKLAEIGRFFGVHYSTISRLVNRRAIRQP